MKKILMVVLDGLADVGETPLMVAEKPNLDYIAKNGVCGLLDNEVGGSDFSETANFHLLGYRNFPGRGYIEALGIGLEPGPFDLCLRCNFSTVSPDMVVLDRRAGREETGLDELASALSNLKVKNCRLRFFRGLGHRGVLIIRGEVDENISPTDPMKTGERVLDSRPTIPETHPRFPTALRTARILNEFTSRSYELLSGHPVNDRRRVPANIILSRYPGIGFSVESFARKYAMSAGCVSAVPATLGMGRLLGMDVLRVGTGTPDTNLELKVAKALEMLETRDFVFLHVKGCDVLSHDANRDGKIKFIERLDSEFFAPLLGSLPEDCLLVVTSDHVTSSLDGEHKSGVVPIAIYGAGKDDVESFDERSVAAGDLGLIHASDLMEKLISLRG